MFYSVCLSALFFALCAACWNALNATPPPFPPLLHRLHRLTASPTSDVCVCACVDGSGSGDPQNLLTALTERRHGKQRCDEVQEAHPKRLASATGAVLAARVPRPPPLPPHVDVPVVSTIRSRPSPIPSSSPPLSILLAAASSTTCLHRTRTSSLFKKKKYTHTHTQIRHPLLRAPCSVVLLLLPDVSGSRLTNTPRPAAAAETRSANAVD